MATKKKPDQKKKSTALVKKEKSEVDLAKKEAVSQIELIKNNIAVGATDDELKIFIRQCERTKLDPFDRQIYFIRRKQYVDGKYIDKMSIEVSIDGMRLIAERTGKYCGQTPVEWCGDDGIWKDVWLKDTPPAAARVGVLKAGFTQPIVAVAKYNSYAAKKSDGTVTAMWKKMPEIMLGKCAEALALRKAFPRETSNIYTVDEMQQAMNQIEYTGKTELPHIEHKEEPAEPMTIETACAEMRKADNMRGLISAAQRIKNAADWNSDDQAELLRVYKDVEKIVKGESE